MEKYVYSREVKSQPVDFFWEKGVRIEELTPTEQSLRATSWFAKQVNLLYAKTGHTYCGKLTHLDSDILRVRLKTGRIIGAAFVEPVSPHTPESVELVMIKTLKAYRKQGLATDMIQQILEITGVKSISLLADTPDGKYFFAKAENNFPGVFKHLPEPDLSILLR